MQVLEHDENRSRRCGLEESKPEIIQETDILDLRCRRVQKLLHPVGVRPVPVIVDSRQKDPNRGHRRCQGDLGPDVQALPPRGRKTELSRARSTSATNVVLPIPASPATNTTCGCP